MAPRGAEAMSDDDIKPTSELRNSLPWLALGAFWLALVVVAILMADGFDQI